MKIFRSQSFNPAYNLALEQFLFETKKPGESIVLLWQNDNAVVVGRYQNVFEEVDIDYANEIGAKIVRRMTGGGAVYHDLGNLNYSFIVDTTEELKHCQEAFLYATLRKIGIKYEIVGRNDILVNGAKISGCAECGEDGKILHHGTLLIKSDLNVLEKILTRNNKITAQSVKSTPRKVMNLSNFMAEVSVESLINAFSEVSNEEGFGGKCFLEEEIKDSQQIAEITKRRYDNDEWTYGFPPKYKYRNSRRYETGQVCVSADIRDNLISDIKFSGDFMALRNVHELENLLKGLVWSSNSALKQFLIKYGNGYILGLQGSDIALLFDKFMVCELRTKMKMVQKEKLERLIAYAKNNNLPLGASEERLTALLNSLENDEQNLQYSNDTEIDMIISKVCVYTNNENLRSFLRTIKAENLTLIDIVLRGFQSERIQAWAYPSNDDSHGVIATRLLLKKLEQLSNVASTIFLRDYFRLENTCTAVSQFLVSTVYAYDHDSDEDFDETYAYAQGLLTEADQNQAHFTDYLVYFAREVYESAVAFIVGHEIGHHFLGHVGNLLKQDISDYNNNHIEEFSADDFGVYFTVKYMQACLFEGNRFTWLQEDVFKRIDYRLFGILVSNHLIECITHNAESSTHPSASRRLARNFEMLGKCGISTVNNVLLLRKQELIATLEDVRDMMKYLENRDESGTLDE